VSTCLVTGGAGFLGSHLCDALLARGNRVICVDNLETGSLANIEHIRDPEHFTHLGIDIIEPYFVEEPVDFVYHLASPASPIDYLRLPLHTLKVGSYGTHHTLGLAKAKRARFLIASTSEVYGDPQEHPQSESYWGHVNPIGVRSCYDEGKRVAESLMMDYHRQNNVDTKIVRIFNTYGPRMAINDGRVVSNFCVAALRNEDLVIFGDGTQTRSFAYVDDIIDALVRMMDGPEGFIGPVNIGNPDEFTILQLASLAIQFAGGSSQLSFQPARSDDPVRRRPDISLAREQLKWEPRIALHAGLKVTMDHFRHELGKA
jgi:dTDP-glucose 4,6-dehydratase